MVRYSDKNCLLCGKIFTPLSSKHKYCGNFKEKGSCSFIARKKYNNELRKTPESRAKNSIRKIKYKKNHPDYVERQNSLNKQYREKNFIKLKEYQKKWRKENINKILELNRKRVLIKRNVKGFHTKKDWERLKQIYNFRCAKCGISEKDLIKKWGVINKYFGMLTKDHIIPISLGGTDNIGNIQPLCISCNSSKHNNKPIIGYLPATFDLFHIGHLRAIKKCASKCDYLIIGLLDFPDYKKTIIPYSERKEIVKSIPFVKEVRKQKSLKMNLKGIDLVFSGDGFEPEEIESINKQGCKAVNIGYYAGQSTTKIKEKISRLYLNKR